MFSTHVIWHSKSAIESVKSVSNASRFLLAPPCPQTGSPAAGVSIKPHYISGGQTLAADSIRNKKNLKTPKDNRTVLLLQIKRLKWSCHENAAGALYKLIKREKLVNVSRNCGRIEMSATGVWMERGRKQFEEMMVDCSMHSVQWRGKHDHPG